MIPTMIVRDGLIFNIGQLIKFRDLTKPGSEDRIECTFTGGIRETFTGEEARRVRAQVAFVHNTWQQIVAAAAQSEQLVKPARGVM